MDDLFTKIDDSVQDSIGRTSKWSSNQEKWHKLRMRVKKAKTFPFVGSSNIRMPTIETKLRKLKAGLVNTIFGIRPVVSVTPSPSSTWESAKNVEKFLDHLIMDVMKIKKKAIIAIDQTLEKGFYLLKPYWRVEITKREETFSFKELTLEEIAILFDVDTPRDAIVQEVIRRLSVDMDDMVAEDNLKIVNDVVEKVLSGEDNVKFNVKDITYNFPDVALASPERVYVSTDTGHDPQTSTMITHEFFLPYDQVKMNAEEKGWDKDVVEKLKDFKGLEKDKLTDTQKDYREGIERINDSIPLVRIWETYGWIELEDGEGVNKAQVTSFPDFKEVARKRKLDSFSGKFPFVKLFYELIDDRWFAHRGLGEMLEDVVKEIDIQHNMKIDAQTMRNAPTVVYRAGMINPDLVGATPAGAIPVNGLSPLNDTIQVLNTHNPNVEFSYEREQQILESKIEEMVGQIDFTLQSQINRREPRTLGEVELQQQSANQVFSLDADMFVEQFSELFNFIYDLWCQHGPDVYEFKYFGDSSQGETVKITKEEVQGKYTIKVHGNDRNTNPQEQMQKAQQILQGVMNPLLLQTGMVGAKEIANGMKRFYKTLDVEDWEQFINVQGQPPQQDGAAEITPTFNEMTEMEQAQVLAKAGIQPDVQARQSQQMRRSLKETGEAEKSFND